MWITHPLALDKVYIWIICCQITLEVCSLVHQLMACHLHGPLWIIRYLYKLECLRVYRLYRAHLDKVCGRNGRCKVNYTWWIRQTLLDNVLEWLSTLINQSAPRSDGQLLSNAVGNANASVGSQHTLGYHLLLGCRLGVEHTSKDFLMLKFYN